MTNITTDWLTKNNACTGGIVWVTPYLPSEGVLLMHRLIAGQKLGWANWLIVRLMTHKQRISYAIFAAEQVIGIFEEEYPNDKRPRLAIEAAKKCLKNNTTKNKAASEAASKAASKAASVASKAASAASKAASVASAASAASAASVASKASEAASEAASAASWAGWWEASAASWEASAAASVSMKTKILNYGIVLLEVKP